MCSPLPHLQLLGPMARLIPKAMLLARRLTPAVRQAMAGQLPQLHAADHHHSRQHDDPVLHHSGGNVLLHDLHDW